MADAATLILHEGVILRLKEPDGPSIRKKSTTFPGDIIVYGHPVSLVGQHNNECQAPLWPLLVAG